MAQLDELLKKLLYYEKLFFVRIKILRGAHTCPQIKRKFQQWGVSRRESTSLPHVEIAIEFSTWSTFSFAGNRDISLFQTSWDIQGTFAVVGLTIWPANRMVSLRAVSVANTRVRVSSYRIHDTFSAVCTRPASTYIWKEETRQN